MKDIAPLDKTTMVETNPINLYDAAIVGGGLAGLSLSIQLAKSGYKVILFEKEQYPFHKVCGEYISLESWKFLESLGLPLKDWNLPLIKRLLVSAPNGEHIERDLPLGGFGLSRFKLDAELAAMAVSCGVALFEQTKVTEVIFKDNYFDLVCGDKQFRAKTVSGCFGKRSNLDIRWNMNFIRRKKSALNNFMAVKYHIEIDFPSDLIALHNFRDGYCGISRIENNKYCLCYLTKANNLQQSGNSIKTMENQILKQNPFLNQIFSKANFLYRQPLTISQISFSKKIKIYNHILLIGDAAGSIAPLCGNGMSMALHGSKIAFGLISKFLTGEINRIQMERDYKLNWNKNFNRRLATGRTIQRLFGNPRLTNLLVKILKPFPKFVTYLISQTHGQTY